MLFSPGEPHANYLVPSSNAVMIIFLCINAQSGFKMELVPSISVVKASALVQAYLRLRLLLHAKPDCYVHAESGGVIIYTVAHALCGLRRVNKFTRYD